MPEEGGGRLFVVKNNFGKGVCERVKRQKGTASLSTIAAVVKQAEGDKYVTSSPVLSFINTCMKSLAEDGNIWARKGREILSF